MKNKILFFGIIFILGFLTTMTAYAVDCNSCENCTAEAVGGNKVLTVTAELDSSATGTCILVNASNTEIDCQGHNITAGTSGTDCGIDAWQVNFINITVKNCNFIAGTYGYGSWVNDSVDYNNNATNDITYPRYSYYDTNVTIRDSNYGWIILDHTADSDVYNNNLINSEFPIDRGAITLDTSSNNNISYNTFVSITGVACGEPPCHVRYGIYLKSDSDNNFLQANDLSVVTNANAAVRVDSTANNNELIANTLPGTTFYGSKLGGIYALTDITLSGQSISKESSSRVLWSAFTGTLTSSMDDYVSVGSRYVSVDSANAPVLNTTATVTLSYNGYCPVDIYYYNQYSTDIATIVGSGQICNASTTPACTNIACTDGSVTFNVAHFDSYGAGDGAVPELSDIAFILTIAGVMGMFVYMRRKN